MRYRPSGRLRRSRLVLSPLVLSPPAFSPPVRSTLARRGLGLGEAGTASTTAVAAAVLPLATARALIGTALRSAAEGLSLWTGPPALDVEASPGPALRRRGRRGLASEPSGSSASSRLSGLAPS